VSWISTSTPTKSLPAIPLKVTIVAGQANALSFVPHLHFQKTTGLVDISNTGVERIVTDPDLPGFQMRIPAGAQIIGWDGQLNTQLSVRRVPIDRIPVPPLPAGLVTTAAYMDYFAKPGGGTPTEPIPVTLPNDLDLPPGTQAQLWYFDEAPDGSRPNQWAQYGTGTVSANGSQIVPDINPSTGKQYGQPRFCCGMNLAAFFEELLRLLRALLDFIINLLSVGPDNVTDGDPVDLYTGQFTLEKADLVLPGRIPLTWTRTYRPKGPPSGPFGRGTSHAYQSGLISEGDLRTLVLPDGRQFAFPKQSDGTFRNVTDAAMQGGLLTESGGVPTLRWKDGSIWTFGAPQFAGQTTVSFLIRQTNRTGDAVTITRTGATVTAISGPDGRQLTLDADGSGRLTKVTDPIGRQVLYAYDSVGNLATVTDPEGGVTRYAYDSANRMTTITDPKGITFLQNFYGPSGRVLRQIQADGSEYRFRYQLTGATVAGPCTNPSVLGNVVSVVLPIVLCPTVDSWENLQASYTITGGTVTGTTVVDPRGNATTTRFNNRGYRTSVTDAVGQTSTSQLNAANQVASSTDPLGRTTKFEYDGQGNVTKITDPTNQATLFEYEPTFNRVKKITDALNQITEFTYDPTNGNLLTVKDPRNQVTTIAYNPFGQPLSVQGPIATEPPTTFAYDTNGNLITTTDPLGNATQRVYDAVSRLTSLTDPRGLSTLFRYDGLNRVTEIADARQGITRFTYDPNGNLLTVADAKNQATIYSYDSMDRLVTRKDALNRQESYQYDLAGNLSQFTDRKNQQTTFVYDALNRRTTATYPDSSTSFIYDSVGRLTKASDTAPGAGTIDFAYDTLDRLIQEVTGQGSVNYQYDMLGRRTQMVANGQQPVGYTYDAASRLTQVAQGALAVGLGYDNANRRISLTYPNGTSTSYGYDVASRLTGLTHLGPSGIIEALTYQYDAAGNRTNLTRNNGTASLLPAAVASATYDTANEQTAFAGAALTYDSNGNLTSDGINAYVWDARNRLVSISGGATANFVYDPLGRRTNKIVNSVGSQFLYDSNDIAAEIGGGAVGANYLRSLNIDEPFIRQSSTGNEYYHTDALGGSLALSNTQGGSATTYSYEPFGKTSVTGTSSNAFQYTGRENDGTGLSYYRARYYSSMKQRFLGEDPIGFRGGVNVYAYVENNPLGFVDPFGFDKGKKGCAAGEQSTSVTKISILEKDSGPVIQVDLETTGFLQGASVSLTMNTGSLGSDFNPAGPNKVLFTLYASNSSNVGPLNAQGVGTAAVQIPISGLQSGQYVQLIPSRLRDPYAPVVTPFIPKSGRITPKPLNPQTNYDSKCQ
jgi:RHS repeat-associated protein